MECEPGPSPSPSPGPGSRRLRVRAPAKVNLSLFLGPTRPDGRHELVTLYQSLSLCDELEVLAGAGARLDRVRCAPAIDGENIAARALAALRARGWDGPPLDVLITKRIPVAAGMAGGSADAAAVLRAAMAMSDPARLRAEEVEQVAAELGSDVPAQLLPGVSLGTGAGEVVAHFEPLAEHAYVVLPAPFGLSTPDVYREADRLGLSRDREALEARYEHLVQTLAPRARPPDELLVNDLEPAAVSLQPWCARALADLRRAGAQNAMVSGSGPTVVGIWWGPAAVLWADAAVTALAADHPAAVVAEPVNAEFALPSLT